MAERLRQEIIDSIMRTKFGDDDPKYESKSREFLEGLTTEKLKDLCEEVILESELKN